MMEQNVQVLILFFFYGFILLLFEVCGDLNYGYNCNESCNCNFGTCNSNATSANQSCTCNAGYEPPFCDKLIDICGKNID
jgi:hypothetical protein